MNVTGWWRAWEYLAYVISHRIASFSGFPEEVGLQLTLYIYRGLQSLQLVYHTEPVKVEPIFKSCVFLRGKITAKESESTDRIKPSLMFCKGGKKERDFAEAFSINPFSR